MQQTNSTSTSTIQRQACQVANHLGKKTKDQSCKKTQPIPAWIFLSLFNLFRTAAGHSSGYAPKFTFIFLFLQLFNNILFFFLFFFCLSLLRKRRSALALIKTCSHTRLVISIVYQDTQLYFPSYLILAITSHSPQFRLAQSRWLLLAKIPPSAARSTTI